MAKKSTVVAPSKAGLKDEKANCCTKRKGRKVSFGEFGKRLIVDLESAGAESVLCQMDGCLVKNKTAPDFALTDENSYLLLAELKGKDVVHALSQIEAGFVHWGKQGRPLGSRRSGVVVCNEVPREQSRIQLAKLKLARAHGAAIHIYSRDTVEELLSRLLEFR